MYGTHDGLWSMSFAVVDRARPRSCIRNGVMTFHKWQGEPLSIQPEDIPFLEMIGGHDDGELIRLGAITEKTREAAMAASLDGDRFEVTLPAGAQVVAQLDAYAALHKAMMPAAQLEVNECAAGVQLVFTSLPPAMQ